MAANESSTSQSMSVSIQTSRFSIPAPRCLGEFIINPRRWKIPNLKRSSELWHQIKLNLLYFQTNYLILSLVVFAGLIILSMKTLLTGIVSAIVLIIAALFFFEHIPQARQIKQNHPTVVIVCGVILIIVTWHALHTILLVVGIAMAPLPLWLLHASLRSADNLVDRNQMGGDYFINTPLGQIMQMVGIDPRPASA